MSDKPLTVGTATAEPGERVEGSIHVGRLYDSSAIAIPVAVVNGAHPGKTVWIHGGVHGNEIVGPRAIQLLLGRLDPSRLNGAVVAIPVANIQAFRVQERSAPQDGLDMNRVWPGAEINNARSLSVHSELAVHRMFQAIVNISADAVVDCHSGGAVNIMANWAAFADYGDAANEAKRLAESAGFDVIWGRKQEFVAARVSGSAGDILSARGIPYVVLEAGGLATANHDAVAAMLRALENILKATGVLSGLPDVARPARRVVRGHWIRANEGGMIDRKVDILQQVSQGDVIATIHDIFGRTIEEVRAPATGIVIGLRFGAVIASGEYVGNVSEPE